MYRILLVDDETDVRESIARMIDWDTQGFRSCGCAAGSLEALEMADELLPDVVMTDICMPYIDGLELIRRLRKVHLAMQFVIVSGYDDFSYAQQAAAACDGLSAQALVPQRRGGGAPARARPVGCGNFAPARCGRVSHLRKARPAPASAHGADRIHYR